MKAGLCTLLSGDSTLSLLTNCGLIDEWSKSILYLRTLSLSMVCGWAQRKQILFFIGLYLQLRGVGDVPRALSVLPLHLHVSPLLCSLASAGSRQRIYRIESADGNEAAIGISTKCCRFCNLDVDTKHSDLINICTSGVCIFDPNVVQLHNGLQALFITCRYSDLPEALETERLN